MAAAPLVMVVGIALSVLLIVVIVLTPHVDRLASTTDKVRDLIDTDPDGKEYGTLRTVTMHNLFPQRVAVYFQDNEAGAFIAAIDPLDHAKVRASDNQIFFVTEENGSERLAAVTVRAGVSEYDLAPQRRGPPVPRNEHVEYSVDARETARLHPQVGTCLPGLRHPLRPLGLSVCLRPSLPPSLRALVFPSAGGAHAQPLAGHGGQIQVSLRAHPRHVVRRRRQRRVGRAPADGPRNHHQHVRPVQPPDSAPICDPPPRHPPWAFPPTRAGTWATCSSSPSVGTRKQRWRGFGCMPTKSPTSSTTPPTRRTLRTSSKTRGKRRSRRLT